MKLKQLHIYEDYAKPGSYKGIATFTGSYGETQLSLDETLSKKLLVVVASTLVDSARSVARELTAECINAALPPDERTPALGAVRDELI